MLSSPYIQYRAEQINKIGNAAIYLSHHIQIVGTDRWKKIIVNPYIAGFSPISSPAIDSQIGMFCIIIAANDDTMISGKSRLAVPDISRGGISEILVN